MWESGKDGREYLRVLEFDVARSDWTGRSWKYRVEENGNNIGDFNMIDADTGLIIERDTLEGLPEDVCSGPLRPDCYPAAAKFKRVYKISLKDADADGFVKRSDTWTCWTSRTPTAWQSAARRTAYSSSRS